MNKNMPGKDITKYSTGGGRRCVNYNNINSSTANKTPVSWLHEICTRNNVTPKYELLQVEGAVHEPIFQYRLSLEHNSKIYEESGIGRSKKEAKHNAARAMLKSIEVVAPHELFEMEEQIPLSALQSINDENVLDSNNIHLHSTNDSNEVEGNPVGILQELCMKMKYPPPTYEVEGEEGLPHERLFAMSCRVGDQFVEIGRGKSKKLAKRTAAFNMAKRLRAMPVEVCTSRLHEDDDDIIINKLRLQTKQKSSPANNANSGRRMSRRSKRSKSSSSNISSTSDAGNKAISEIDHVTSSTKSRHLPDGWRTNISGPFLLSLQNNEYIEDPVGLIKKIGKEQSFEVMYIDSEDLSTNGDHQVFAQIAFDTPIVLIGEGKTFREAKKNAAKDVIELFKRFVIKSTKKDDDALLHTSSSLLNINSS